MDKYVIGCDYGTLSMRAVLVRVKDGFIAAEESCAYENGVITGRLPDSGVRLEGPDWALQDPDDYTRALLKCVTAAIKAAGVFPEQVVGIAVDFTTCTVVPMDADGEPLCKDPRLRDRPHAWVKLWKNHTAQKEADDINEYVHKNGLKILDAYGFRASSEFLFPKLLEIYRKDKEVYDCAHTFLEGGDYVTFKLCGKIARSGVMAAAKGFYDNETRAFPEKAFFAGLEPGFKNVVEEKRLENVARVGSPAGTLTPEMAKQLGLLESTVVCTAHADAAVALPGGGVVKPNVMMLVMGTSTCHMMMAKEKATVPGMCAVYYEGILPGYYTYEAGQNAVGDIFDWFCKNCLPEEYKAEAERRGLSAMQLMDEKAAALKIGESGIVALDWMNGNRSVLQDADLSGVLMGLKLSTKPEHIYRALLEATAFGTKIILDRFAEYGIAVEEIFACGGLAHKSPVLMQMYSDVLGLPIKITAHKQTSALASAVFAAVAAGAYGSYEEAAKSMVPPPGRQYEPNTDATKKYREIFAVYKELHDYFGAGGGGMKKLKRLMAQN